MKFPFQQLRPKDSGFQPSRKIWPLTEEETHVMFEKTAKFVRENLQLLVNRSYGTHCFRRHNDCTVYCVNEMILKSVVGISGDKLVLLGRYFEKFPKTHQFQLDITVLDYLAPYAKAFGVAAKSTQDCRRVDTMIMVVFHQADIGEYVWHEETLTLNHGEDLGLYRWA
ncbi:60S ribosome subunit biogenesis protein NIP7 homolog [Bubalus kerabau]|uniref:60S ribosome subunit biogenesis protein NIP7 homolog n=1 Tax=Bubalus bubalis TaxID=89462 RepID=UPI000DBC6577|nr:60S ribosome subunit biogenesis protein NIP7 homolog [Bubalus bubalis]XP_055394991.1 60S ribosome subunit biogenesis protein NIP7 homolog [Bubalus carabanensis]